MPKRFVPKSPFKKTRPKSPLRETTNDAEAAAATRQKYIEQGYDMRNVFRLEKYYTLGKGLAGKSWLVNVGTPKQGRRAAAFSDSKYGGEEGALKAALAKRDEFRKELDKEFGPVPEGKDRRDRVVGGE